jgi:anti-sigma B factor antagonist
MSDPFDVRIEGDARISVRGELDMATAPQLSDAISSAASTGRQRVVLDLSSVTFVDSTGISALCLAQGALEERGAVLVLGSLSPQVQSALQIVGLDSRFVIDASDA